MYWRGPRGKAAADSPCHMVASSTILNFIMTKKNSYLAETKFHVLNFDIIS